MIERKHFLLVAGFIESLCYTGIVFGWATMNYLLRMECVFHHLCPIESDPALEGQDREVETKYMGSNELFANETDKMSCFRSSCPQQEQMLNLAFNISICIGALSGFVWGYVLDKFGIRVLRLLISFFITGGAIMLLLTDKDWPYILFPALTFCAFVGIPIRISCLQITDLFPAQRSTLITLYSGANTASAALFTFLKFPYEAGYSWRETISIFVGFSLFALPCTFFLFPSMTMAQLKKPAKELQTISTMVVAKTQKSPELKKKVEEKSPLPLKLSLISISSLIYNYWVSWLMLYTLYYNGSLHLWVARSTNDPTELARYVEILGISQLAALVIAPVSGMLIDLNLRRLKPKLESALDVLGPPRLLDQVNQVKATFWPILITTLMIAGVQICKFFDSSEAIFTSIFFFLVYRSMLIGVSISYLRERFINEHFNKLVGITATLRGITFFFQFPMFVWESYSPLQVSAFGIVCLAFTFILPFHLLTPFLPFLMKREDKSSSKIFAKNNRVAEEIAVTHL